MNSQKTQGFLLLLILVWLGTFLLNPNFASEYNSRNVIRYCAMFGIIGIGVMFVIVTGGIDLSIGSTVGLIGASLILLLRLNPIDTLKPIGESELKNVVWFFNTIVGAMVVANLAWLVYSGVRYRFRLRKVIFPIAFLLLALLAYIGFRIANSDAPNTTRIPWIIFLLISISLHIGLLHGVLITQFQLQPFVVTLAGLLCYRGIIRWLTADTTQGMGSTFNGSLDLLAKGEICTVSTLMMFFGIGAAIFYLLKLITQKVNDANLRRANFTGLISGAILGIIGSSRFWRGFETKNFEYLFNFKLLGFNVAFPTWDTVVSESAAAMPQYLMKWSWLPMIPCLAATILFLIFSIVANEKRSPFPAPKFLLIPFYLFTINDRHQKNGWFFTILSIRGLIVSLIALYYSYRIVSGAWVLEVSESRLWWIRLMSIFGSLALVMFSISRLGRCIQIHGNQITRLLFPVTGLLAIFSVLGHTQISTTMVQFPFFITIVLAIISIILIDKTVFGRYLLAIGNNEDAAKYSGIDTQEITVAAYVICSGIVGIAAIIFTLGFNSVAPTGFGSFYELYAIAAVVLGGCSLRGGEANIIGVLLGASIMRVLTNAPNMIDFPQTLEYTILGLVILIGVVVDEKIRRQAARKALEQNLTDDEDDPSSPEKEPPEPTFGDSI